MDIVHDFVVEAAVIWSILSRARRAWGLREGLGLEGVDAAKQGNGKIAQTRLVGAVAELRCHRSPEGFFQGVAAVGLLHPIGEGELCGLRLAEEMEQQLVDIGLLSCFNNIPAGRYMLLARCPRDDNPHTYPPVCRTPLSWPRHPSPVSLPELFSVLPRPCRS